MIPAILSGLAAAILLCFILLCFFFSAVFLYEKRAFRKGKGTKEYHDGLHRRYVRSKIARLKNLRLYYLISDYSHCGEEKRAKELEPFLRSDRLFGIQ
ncbi:MAG: hypothetical protein IJC84_02700 [Clostridia bacterium]|nr:hypothetical protein [Clostridia bacterium]